MSSSIPLDPWLGRLLGDRSRYCLKRRIGSGGMGDVYLATDTLLGRPVALKLLNSRLAAAELRRRFEQEVAVCAALKNDHIVQVSDYGVTPEGYPFYIMEYLRGQTLGQLLYRERALSVERAISIITQVCSGLYPAHQGINLWRDGATSSECVKVIHRDLKPDNIFLVPTALGEFVKILDFGIAKIRSSQANYTNLTNMFLGTYQYAAPEQLENEKNLDERADIYSLGMILYEILTGTHPFTVDQSNQTEQQLTGVGWAVAHLTKPPLPLRNQPRCKDLPNELEAVVMRCLEKTPEQRFSSVVELSQALHTAVPNASHHRLVIPQFEEFEEPLSDAVTMLKKRQSVDPQGIIGSSTENATALINTFVYKPVNSSNHSVLLRNPALLLMGVGVMGVLALVFMINSLQLPNFLSSSQAELILQQPQLSPQLAALEEQLSTQSLESSAIDSFSGHTETVWSVAVNPVEKIVVSGGYDKTIRVWNLNGELLRTLYGHADAVRAVALADNGKLLVSGSGDKTIKVWDLRSGKLLRTLTGHSGPIWSVAIGPDGRTLASGSYDGTIRIWNVQTGKQIQTLPEHYDSIWSVAITPNGETLASASYDGTIKLWNLQTGELLRTLSGHADAVRSIAISPDGQTLTSGSWDKTIKLWDLETGNLIKTLSGHNERVLAIAISPDGQTLASGSSDRTIKLWDLQTGKLIRTLAGHSDWVVSVAFAKQRHAHHANQQTLVSGSKDKTVKLWQW